MRLHTCLAVLALFPAAAFADAAYRLDMGTSVHGGSLKVEPTVTGPANKTMRYEMQVRREGSGGSSNSSQSGTVRLDDSGEGRLASSSVSVSPSDRYVVTVKLYDGPELVAQQSAKYP